MALSVDNDDQDLFLRRAVLDLQDTAQIPAKQRPVKITGLIDRVSSKAYDLGLPQDPLQTLLDILTLPNELDQASIGSLIRNLYPATRVNNECVIRVVGALGLGQTKPSFSAQTGLLKWIIMVYDVLENPKVLSQLYSHLFNLLDIIAIRAPLCHLISLITRRRHVRPFRIQALLELARKVGNEPQLVGLIRVYKDYYPDVIIGEATAGRASVFKHPNPEWAQRLSEIQVAHAQRSQDGLQKTNQAFKVVRRGINGAKRSRVSVVPEVHTSRAMESSTTLEEIESVNDFVGKLERINLPNQLVAVLGDPLLQKLVQLKTTPIIQERINNWLTAYFEDILLESGDSIGESLDLLDSIREYTRFTKSLPPACRKFLQDLLHDWNGVTGQDVVLELLSYIPLERYADLQRNIFQPLEEAILDDTPESQRVLLAYYTDILHHWTFILLSSEPPKHTNETTSSLAAHVNILTLTLLQTLPTTQGHSSVLNYYEATAKLHSYTHLEPYVRITTPPETLIYTLYFSSSLSIFSRLCGTLAVYKRAFEAVMTKPVLSVSQAVKLPPAQFDGYPKEYVNNFNGFLMDICNCLWRSRAFNTTDSNAHGCLLPPKLLAPLTDYFASLDIGCNLSALFSLSYSPLLSNQSITYFREFEDEAIQQGDLEGGRPITTRQKGPVSQAGLKTLALEGGVNIGWADYRLGVLRHLERQGVNGVGELMYNTMKHLIRNSQSSPKKSADV